MASDPNYEPEFESFKDLLLEMARERSADALFQLIVRRLAARPHVAMARIWLVRPGDICDSCHPAEGECHDRSHCLHLVATAGGPNNQAEEWGQPNEEPRRFPYGVGIVGKIAATGEPVLKSDLDTDSEWITQPDWAKKEGICGYAGQPLIYRGEVLGALVVFLRNRPQEEGMIWLRMMADHAAAAIANSRAFEEIDRLRKQIELERDYLREEVREAHSFGDIVGKSAALRNVLQQVELVAPTDASVLILGESGTGKELVAREIHKRSPRKDRPMVKVNCASIPHELYESEFFGHVEGAFTGAVKDREGRFQLADGGTLFLDEVGEIPLSLQGKLLRVLQEGEFERVGEEATQRCDVRIIAATNQDLRTEMEARKFRQDLFYRLNVFPVEVAPLRKRKEDIPLLAAHFVALAAAKFNFPLPRLTQANILQLQQYDWPGNVRELQNVVERGVITSGSGALRFELSLDAFPNLVPDVLPDAEMKRRERDNILMALQRTGWKIYGPNGAAELLDLKPTTLASRIKRLGLNRPR